MKRFFGFLIVCVSLSVCAGCKTYRTERIYDDCVKFRGVPVQVFKTHQVQVTWMMGPKVESKDPPKQGGVNEGGTGGGTTEPGANPTAHQAKATQAKNVSLKEPKTAPPVEPKAETPEEPKVYTTTHFCRLPVMYAVDAYGAPVGQDDATIDLNPDGTLDQAKQKRDQRIPELVTAIGDAVPKLAGVKESGGASNNPYDFYPPLPEGAVILSIVGLTEMR